MMTASGYPELVAETLTSLGVTLPLRENGPQHTVHTPITGEAIARIALDDTTAVEQAVARADEAFRSLDVSARLVAQSREAPGPHRNDDEHGDAAEHDRADGAEPGCGHATMV